MEVEESGREKQLEMEMEMDPETEFLLSKRKTENDWEVFKENVRPLKRGRNISLLNNALKSQTNNHLKKSLLLNRRKMIEAIDEYEGEDPLEPWIKCIKWVEEAYPGGGDFSGLVLIYEQCVRTFWHSNRYKDDLRYLNVWLQYADYCFDAQVIFNFLLQNEIGTTHASFYISFASHLESKLKLKAANDIFNLGISRNAHPIDKLKDAYRKFFSRSMKRPKAADESAEKCLPVRSFGTVLSKTDNQMQSTGNLDLSKKNMKPERPRLAPLYVYKDSNVLDSSSQHGHEPDVSKTHLNTWTVLASRGERNKENSALPSKWTSFKIPQRIGSRVGGTSGSSSIDVFVDEECEEMQKLEHDEGSIVKSSTTHLRQVDGRSFKRETELLRQNPLRNFPR